MNSVKIQNRVERKQVSPEPQKPIVDIRKEVERSLLMDRKIRPEACHFLTADEVAKILNETL